MNDIFMNCNLSIVIPFYNGENFLPILLGSIGESYMSSNQQLTFEVILIVDSPESNVLSIHEITDNFKFAKINLIINEQNIGVAKSRDLGIYNAKGDFITFIDQDDNVTKSYFSVLEQKLDHSSDLLVLNGYVNNIVSNKKVPIFYFKPKLELSNFLNENQILTPSLLIIKRNFLLQNEIHFTLPFDDYKGVDDWYFILQILIKMNDINFKWINEFNINYCIHTSNYSNDILESIQGSISLMNYLKALIPNYNILIDSRISMLEFMLTYHTENKFTVILCNPLFFLKFINFYVLNFNRLIRFFHRLLIGLQVRIKN